jgi:hypothetical protein
MRKKVLVSFFVVAVAAIAGWNVNQSKGEVAMSDMALANVEALGSEIGDACGGCSTSCSGTTCCTIYIDGYSFTLKRC